jgi:hypothetical protein
MSKAVYTPPHALVRVLHIFRRITQWIAKQPFACHSTKRCWGGSVGLLRAVLVNSETCKLACQPSMQQRSMQTWPT